MRIDSRFRDLLADSVRRPLIFAHRGACSEAPENTLIAAELGRVAGAVGWELDVHLTRDGIPVVIHDESLTRTTDVAAKFAGDLRERRGFLVADFDLVEIQTLDAGAWFLEHAKKERTALSFGTKVGSKETAAILDGQVRIPTLEDALVWTKANDWFANVELKSFPHLNPHLTQTVLDKIQATDSQESVLISSFDHREIEYVCRIMPEIPTGLLCETPLGASSRYVRELIGGDALHVDAKVLGAESLDYLCNGRFPEMVLRELEELRAAGIAVLAYTVNDPEMAGLLFKAGVAGVFSDTPQRMVQPFSKA